jgi:molybdopterin converting factor small subunit
VIRIELPKALNCYVDGKSVLELDKQLRNVGAALVELGRVSPGVLDRVMDEQGSVRQHVNVFLGGENIRFLNGLQTPVPDGSTILILSAISGG